MSFTFTGVFPILATPFNDDESLDLASLERMIRFNFEAGVDGVTLLGLLGESNRLTEAERSTLITTAIKAAGGRPVVVGTSHTGTAATIELTKQATDLGAAAVMITPSQQPTPSDKAVFDYFDRIAGACPGVPIVLQDHPAISNVHMPVELILRMVKEIPGIIGIKAEAVPSPAKIGALKKGLAELRHVSIMTGLARCTACLTWSAGATGSTPGSPFPRCCWRSCGRTAAATATPPGASTPGTCRSSSSSSSRGWRSGRRSCGGAA